MTSTQLRRFIEYMKNRKKLEANGSPVEGIKFVDYREEDFTLGYRRRGLVEDSVNGAIMDDQVLNSKRVKKFIEEHMEKCPYSGNGCQNCMLSGCCK